MSNFLSLASVTATLATIIQKEIGGHGLSATVAHVRPDGTGGAPPATGVNVYLYQVTTNAAWRNVDLPTRNSNGKLIQRPKVALDLHYLLSFYGSEGSLETQRLLGLTVSGLHARSVLTREKIRGTVKSSLTYPYLDPSDLADEVELVKFTPIPLSLEELSKLWSVFFQTHYTLSIAYQATVVLIDSDIAPVIPLPARAARFYALPARHIHIDSVGNNDPAAMGITPSSTLLIGGAGFLGSDMSVVIGDAEVEPVIVSDAAMTLDLGDVPGDSLRAGVQGVQVINKVPMGEPPIVGGDPLPHTAYESNVAAFVLRPVVTPLSATTNVDDVTTITVTITPTVGRAQRVMLYLNEVGTDTPESYSLLAPAREDDGTTIVFSMKKLKAATFLVRVQVDGAESLLTANANGFYNGPTIVIP